MKRDTEFRLNLKNVLEDNAEDRLGMNAYLTLAHELRELADDDVKREGYIRATVYMVNRISSLEPKIAERLLLFIDFSHLSNSYVKESLRNALASGLSAAKEIGLRAEVLRLLASLGHRFTPKYLEQESAVRQQFPWYWIDALETIDWKLAATEIARVMHNPGSVDHLLARLDYYWENHAPITDLLMGWTRGLNQDDLNRVTAWLENRNASSNYFLNADHINFIKKANEDSFKLLRRGMYEKA